MSTPISANQLHQSGRAPAPDIKQPRIAYSHNANFSAAADIEFDLTVIDQVQIFGIIRCIFVDNGSNPSEIEVSVSQTDQFFTIPPYSEGYFVVNANEKSRVRMVTDGGATDQVTVDFYNYEIPPVVWYRFGAFNKDVPLKVQGTQPNGTDMDTADNNYPVMIAGVQADGTLTRVRVDNLGRLDFASTVTIGAVTIADGADVALGKTTDTAVTNPTLAGTVIGLIKGALTGIGQIADAAVTNPAASGSIIAVLKGILSSVGTAATANKTSVPGAIVDTLLLASNTARKGATVYNDSTSILYLGLGTGLVSATSFTTQVAAGGYYEVPARFTNQIRGIWVTATGNARVTEFV